MKKAVQELTEAAGLKLTNWKVVHLFLPFGDPVADYQPLDDYGPVRP